jgi:hypothetical protein
MSEPAPSSAAGHGATEGGCLCGRLRFRFAGPIDNPHYCSCRMCQTSTGAPIVAWGDVKLDGFAWTGSGGEPTWFRSSKRTRRGHCASCGGGAVCLDDGADFICISLASLDDPNLSVPTGQSFAASSPKWLKLSKSKRNGAGHG